MVIHPYSSCSTGNPNANDILRNVMTYLTFHGSIDDLVVLIPLRIEALRAVGHPDAADWWQQKLDEEMAIRAAGKRRDVLEFYKLPVQVPAKPDAEAARTQRFRQHSVLFTKKKGGK